MIELSWSTIAVVAAAVLMLDFGMMRVARAILDLAKAVSERGGR